MLSESEQHLLARLARHTAHDDPRFAARMSAATPQLHRTRQRVDALVVATALTGAACLAAAGQLSIAIAAATFAAAVGLPYYHPKRPRLTGNRITGKTRSRTRWNRPARPGRHGSDTP